MKTIKNILAVLLMTTMVAVLPSCEKDPQIYGKWKLVSLTLTNGEQSESIPIGKGLTVEFKKNGQAVLAMGGEEVAKEYTLHGNNLVLKDWYSEHIIEDVEIENSYDVLGTINILTKTDLSIELYFSDEALETMEEEDWASLRAIVDFERL
ncbi:MAG: hypothetical protein IKM99_08195 [Bacteroidales bacterium]|nr:hypothetical protein [Bacteroidales bacterium]